MIIPVARSNIDNAGPIVVVRLSIRIVSIVPTTSELSEIQPANV